MIRADKQRCENRKAHRHGSTVLRVAGYVVKTLRNDAAWMPSGSHQVAGREVELPAWTQWSREDPLGAKGPPADESWASRPVGYSDLPL